MEDDYLLTGHIDGKIFLYLLKPIQIEAIDPDSGNNPYRDLFIGINDRNEKIRSVLIGFRLVKTFYFGGIKRDLSYLEMNRKMKRKERKGRRIVKLGSNAKKNKLFSLNGKGEIYVWYV